MWAAPILPTPTPTDPTPPALQIHVRALLNGVRGVSKHGRWPAHEGPKSDQWRSPPRSPPRHRRFGRRKLELLPPLPSRDCFCPCTPSPTPSHLPPASQVSSHRPAWVWVAVHAPTAALSSPSWMAHAPLLFQNRRWDIFFLAPLCATQAPLPTPQTPHPHPQGLPHSINDG